MKNEEILTRAVNVLLFDGFELLDMAGPVELLSQLPDEFDLEFVAAKPGPNASAQGVKLVATTAYEDATPGGILLVPGGHGHRALLNDAAFLAWLRNFGEQAELVTSVCTGSVLLATAGLLDGRRATSNKQAFTWAASHGDDVDWVPSARWVEDGNRWTSSGVAAGMDMYAEIIRRIAGVERGRKVTDDIELETHDDASWDPFAAVHGLVGEPDGADAAGHPGGKAAHRRTPEVDDTRDDLLDFLDDERQSLRSWLEFYRATVPIKLAGLTAEQLCERSVPPSTMSLIGVVRHLLGVESYWFRLVALGQDETDPPFSWDPATDDDFDRVDPATAFADLAAYAAELDHSRAAEASFADLDAPVIGRRGGEELNLRWIMVHLIEEYARHLGHVDLLREALDGRTGY